ncbi:MAG: metal-dependent hydrolase, partial [Acidimicrobiia bacterium]
TRQDGWVPAITVRRPTFDLGDLPHRWVGGSALGTWFGDAAHVFIPLGERFFIDAVKRFRDGLDDDLRREVASFMGQEAVHARVHQAVWDNRRAHGVPIDRYAAFVERFQRTLDPLVGPELQLAATAALEHYTAVFGQAFLEEDLDEVVGREMAALLRWHGAEEIEHRSVAFDVLDVVDPRLATRLAGLALGTALLLVVPGIGVAMFALADLRAGRLRRPRLPDPRLVGMSARLLRQVAADLARYAAPGFRPGDEPVPAAYERWLGAQAA